MKTTGNQDDTQLRVICYSLFAAGENRNYYSVYLSMARTNAHYLSANNVWNTMLKVRKMGRLLVEISLTKKLAEE
jgi:hypothetical protein